jgi:hypothetical protein
MKTLNGTRRKNGCMRKNIAHVKYNNYDYIDTVHYIGSSEWGVGQVGTVHHIQKISRNTEWCKSQDTLETRTHLNMFFPYDFAFNLIPFCACPYKYICKHIHKYSFTLLKMAAFHLDTTFQPGMASVSSLFYYNVQHGYRLQRTKYATTGANIPHAE